MFDDTSFFYFDEENMIIYKINHDEISCQKITKEQLETEYIDIEKILESAVYIGDYRKIMGTISVKYLYETDKITIYYQGNQFVIKPKSKLYNIELEKQNSELNDIVRTIEFGNADDLISFYAYITTVLAEIAFLWGFFPEIRWQKYI